jgi:hypothetical protein
VAVEKQAGGPSGPALPEITEGYRMFVGPAVGRAGDVVTACFSTSLVGNVGLATIMAHWA